MEVDFGKKSAGEDWRVINDGVMGGLSKGEMALNKQSIGYSGEVSLANNGGFSSLKGPFTPTDLSGFSSCKIRYRSTGIQIAFTLELSRAFYDPYFKALLPSTAGEWQEIEVSFNDFKAYSLGRRLDRELNAEVLEKIIRIGFITGEKRAGPFYFEVDYLQFS